MTGGLIDTHCHLSSPRFQVDRAAVIARMRTAGLRQAICIATGIDDAAAVWAIHESDPDFIQVAAGLDPFTCDELGSGFEAAVEELQAFLQTHACVGLGEIGLDYHYQLQPRPRQIAQLHRQLSLAGELQLPVVIHVREAHADMAAVLAEHPHVSGVIHSFTGGPAEAVSYLQLDWHLAFNGVVTFKNAEEVREALLQVPDERLLFETDSPFLAPVPQRGKRCEPALINDTARFCAEVRGQAVDELARITSTNAIRLFALPLSVASPQAVD